VTPRTRAALAACAERGVTVVVVTARRWLAASPLLADLGLSGHAIVAGGGAVRRLPDGRIVLGSQLRHGVVEAVASGVARAGLQPLVAVDHGERHLAGDPREDGPAAGRYLARGRTVRVGPSGLPTHLPVTRVLAMGAASRIHAAAAFCLGLDCHLLVQDCIYRVDAAGQRPLEFHAAAATKGTALRRLCAQLGVPTGEVLAIGDARSDLAMLEVAGTPVLMGQAEPGLRRPGVRVAPPVDEDGAAQTIEELVLNRS
jgi:HAD superfamily hydrolase (TIGR01484 family)